MNKKAIQLSVNFVVVLIIAVVVFGMGLTFAYNLLGQANTMKQDLDRETQLQIEALLDEGLPVAIPLNRKTVRLGKTGIIGLGINNRLGHEEDFTITIEASAAFDDEKQDITPLPQDNWWVTHTQEVFVENNKYQKIPLAFITQKTLIPSGPSTKFGLYIFDVRVTYNDPVEGTTTYGNVQKVYLEVI